MRCTPKRIIGVVMLWQFAIVGTFLFMFAPEHKVRRRLGFHRQEIADPDINRLRIFHGGGNGTPFLPRTTLHRVLVSNRYKTLFCYVPKVACSNWKRVFLVLEGHFNTTAEIDYSFVHNLTLEAMNSLIYYPKIEIDRMLQSYKKIVFVREPMERILSAYVNKFAHDAENRKYHHKYGIDIIQKYRKNFTGEVTDEQYTTFNEFVKYLIDLQPYEKRNEHWNLQYNLCSPNIINYDFIGKYDTLKSDAARALELMGASDVVTFPDNGKPKPEGQETKTLMKTFYSLISELEFNQLQEGYDKDYETFGFYKPSYREIIGQLSSEAWGNKTKDVTAMSKD
ncbi:hypothetical protein ACROYT_G019649 [Oculina patagonica]